MILGTALGIIGLAALYAVIVFNRLIRLRNLKEEGWSGVDVQLKRRWDLIPNLTETVKGYAAHEKGLFEEVSRARAAAMGATTPQERGAAEGILSMGLKNLFAIAEAYPELKASDNFRQLQENLAQIEDQVQLARRYYNGTVRDYNIQVEGFPSNLIASAFGHRKAEYFEIESAEERTTPKVSF
jgi:LemA protein